MLFSNPALDDSELEALAQIDELKERLRLQLHEPRRWVGSLRRLSFARALRGSNTIEGYEADLDDAAAVAAGEEPLQAGDETRLALEGYRDAMTFVLQLAGDEDFLYSEQLFKSLHFVMTSFDLKNRPGRWRTGAVWVRDEETGLVVYEGAEVDDIPALMAELVADLNRVDDTPMIVRAAMAHLNLVMIHPFKDGNGRMARCLQSLVIARGGVLSPVFMSVEEYLGRASNTTDYYRVLQQVGAGRWAPERDARPWVRFILTAHVRQARTMLRRVRESERLWTELERLVAKAGLPERTLSPLFDAALGLRVRNGLYRAMLEELEAITENTASRDLKHLVEAGLLEPHGERRGRFYLATPALRDVYSQIASARDPRDESDPLAIDSDQ
ncbi:MAG: Fic family protein [Acidimicrobiia bacterium]